MHRLRVVSVAVAAAVALWAQARPEPVSSGAQLLTFHSSVDDSDQPYAVYLPETPAPGRKYPLVISLHSEESSYLLNLRQALGVSRPGAAVPADMRLFPAVRGIDYIVACPSARGSMGYRGIAEKDVYDVLDDLERRFPIDPARIYLTGVSMGGAGALRLALTRPDVWAGVAPVAAYDPPGADELAGNALNLPVRLYQGEHDPLVPVEIARAWQRRLLDAEAPAGYVEFPTVRHNAWDFAYRADAVYAWFDKQRRNLFPERVRFTTRSYRYAGAHWVHIDGLTPGERASIDARRFGPTEVRVETEGVDGFTLALDRVISTVTIDGSALRLRPAATISFQKIAGRWQRGNFTPAGKRPGAEGPIAEAVAARHIYVYGTVGASTAEELDARRLVAETASRWSTPPRSRLALTLPVKADSAVTPEDLDSADLVLFGTSQTNQIIANLAPSLPLALDPGAADYGLLFIAPAGKHYVLVSSGLPWWTGADESRGGGDPFAPRQLRLLQTFSDYILFKGSLSNVVAEGRFDRNWKVPTAAASKLGCRSAESPAHPLSCIQ
jgi:pimeloyl-ACP methyl ester carboxylesterase